MIRTIKQKSLIAIIWGTSMFISIVTLTKEICGVDELVKCVQASMEAQKKIELAGLTAENAQLQAQVEAQKTKLESSKAQHAQAKSLLGQIKEAIGGSGANTPELPRRIINLHVSAREMPVLKQEQQRLTEEIQAIQVDLGSTKELHARDRLLIEEIRSMAGEDDPNTLLLPLRIANLRQDSEKIPFLEQEKEKLRQEQERLKQELQATQITWGESEEENGKLKGEISDLKTSLGGEDHPPADRMRKLSDSLKKGATDLTEAVGALDQKLQDIPGEDYASKVAALLEERECINREREDMHKTLAALMEDYENMSKTLAAVQKMMTQEDQENQNPFLTAVKTLFHAS